MEIGAQGRRIAARIALGLSLVMAGAFVTIMLLAWQDVITDDVRRRIMNTLLFAFFVLSMASNMLDPKNHPEVKDPSPGVLGVIVVAPIGLAASAVLSWNGWYDEAGIVLIITWIAMLFVWRFATGRMGAARPHSE